MNTAWRELAKIYTDTQKDILYDHICDMICMSISYRDYVFAGRMIKDAHELTSADRNYLYEMLDKRIAFFLADNPAELDKFYEEVNSPVEFVQVIDHPEADFSLLDEADYDDNYL